jgi:hypothetical protein
VAVLVEILVVALVERLIQVVALVLVALVQE